MTKMIYALCVCVFNLLKIYTNLPVGKSMHIYRKRARPQKVGRGED